VGFGPLSPDETVARRLEAYRRQMAPVIELYRQRGLLVDVDASLAVEAVRETVIRTVGAPVGA
jgi:adenylate kinase